MTFPLPLVAFEDYMLADDRQDYPMHFGLRLRFVGRLDRGAVVQALRVASARHPLLTARIGGAGSRGRFWHHPLPAQEIPLRETSSPAGDGPPFEPLDLTTVGGLVVHWIRHADGDELYWQFHHACCDGLGGARVVADWLIGYAQAVGEAVPEDALPPLDPERLRGRGRFGLTLAGVCVRLRRLSRGLSGIRMFFGRRPETIAPVTSSAAFDAYVGPSLCEFVVSPAVTAALGSAARRTGATVNDLLLAACLTSLAAFRRRRRGCDDDWLRIAVPVSLRRAGDERLPAANVVGMVFFDQRGRDVADRAALVQVVHHWMRRILQNELTLLFIFSLAMGRRLPGGLLSRRDRVPSAASCVASNLGRPLKTTVLRRDETGRILLGRDLALKTLELVVPIRAGTGAAFGFVFYAGRLHLTLNYDPRMLSAETARELLDTFVGEIVATAAEGDGADA